MCATSFAEPGGELAARAGREASADARGDVSALTRRVVYSATLAYGLLFVAASIVSYLAFQEARLDLGDMVQAVWSTSHGHFLRVTTGSGHEMSRLGAHVDPFLALLAPIWWLIPSPMMILILQAAAVSTGALPVYWLARKHLHNERTAAYFAFAYLLYPVTQFNALSPIGPHAVSFAIPLILFAIWFLDEDRIVVFALFAVIAASTKEEVAAAVGCLGLWYGIRKGHHLLGGSIFVIGFGITLANMLVVIPHYAQNGVSPFAGRYEGVGGTPGGMLHTAVTNPVAFVDTVVTWHKLLWFVLLFAPFLGLWLFEPLILIGAVPDLAINLLSSKPEQTTIFYQYTAGILPFVIAASVLGAARLKRDPARRTRWVLGLAAALGFLSPLVAPATHVALAQSSNPAHRAKIQALRLIPSNARVSASNRLGGYLSERRYIATFPHLGTAQWAIVETNAPHGDIKAMTDGRSAKAKIPWEVDVRTYKQAIARLETNLSWRLVDRFGDVEVFERRGQ
jgi:uncharacterized membrane protein